jgi:hypothetical protein
MRPDRREAGRELIEAAGGGVELRHQRPVLGLSTQKQMVGLRRERRLLEQGAVVRCRF